MTAIVSMAAGLLCSLAPQQSESTALAVVAGIIILVFILAFMAFTVAVIIRTTRRKAYKDYLTATYERRRKIDESIRVLQEKYQETKETVSKALTILDYTKMGFSVNVKGDDNNPEKKELRQSIVRKIFDENYHWTDPDYLRALGCLTDDKNISNPENGYNDTYRKMYLRGLLEDIKNSASRDELITYMMNLDWFECSVKKTADDFSQLTRKPKGEMALEEKQQEVKNILNGMDGAQEAPATEAAEGTETKAAGQVTEVRHRRNWPTGQNSQQTKG